MKLRKLLKDEPDKYIKNSLHGLIEERYLLFILEQAEIDNETKQVGLNYYINPGQKV